MSLDSKLGRRRFLGALAAATPIIVALSPLERIVRAAEPAQDYDITINGVRGHYWTQTGGYGMVDPMLKVFESIGGANVWGPPVSREWLDNIGRINQAIQRGIIQIYNPHTGEVSYANIFDLLHDRGLDGMLEAQRNVAPHRDLPEDEGLSMAVSGQRETIIANHLRLIEPYEPIMRWFNSNKEDWLNRFGLPINVEEYENWISVRWQRVALQLWKIQHPEIPGIKPGTVTLVLGGDFAKEFGLIPAHAVQTHLPNQNVYISLGYTFSDTVTTPPAYLNLDPFYQKYLDANGIPILSSGSVQDNAFYAARDIVNNMLATRQDIRQALIANNMRVAIMAETEVTTDIPENRNIYERNPGTDWNSIRGISGTPTVPLAIDEENLLYCPSSEVFDRYGKNVLLIHELGHAIMDYALPPEIVAQIKGAFNTAIATGLWPNTTAGRDPYEYFPEGVQSWFNANAQNITNHNHVNTREELVAYDPRIASIISEVFRNNPWRYTIYGDNTCPVTNTR